MSAAHGTFVLLIDGKANCYSSTYDTIIARLSSEYEKHPSADFLITQVVGTVDKPKVPVVHCIYNAQNI
jgi:hypothetical protein